MALSCFLKLSSSVLRSHAGKTLPNRIINSSLSSLAGSSQLLDRRTVELTAVSRRELATSRVVSEAHKAHDHVTIWKIERVLSIALLPLIPAALASPCKALDTIVAVLIVMHNHWGLEAIVVDYVRPILFGELAPKIGLGLLYLFSVLTLAGLLNLIYNDVGLANAFLALWKKPEPSKAK